MVMVIVMVMVRGTGQARLSGVFAQKKSFVESFRRRKEDGSPRPLCLSSNAQSLSQLCQTFCTSSLSSSMSMSFSMFFTSPSLVRVM